eukprot:COSAG06_NODE_700_length_12958_cov_24.639941_5_plen_298_part_00
MCQPALANPGTGQCREGANPALASAGVKFPALASEKSSQLHCWPVQGKRRTRSFLLTRSGQCRARSVCNCSARGIASGGQRLACALASCKVKVKVNAFTWVLISFSPHAAAAPPLVHVAAPLHRLSLRAVALARRPPAPGPPATAALCSLPLQPPPGPACRVFARLLVKSPPLLPTPPLPLLPPLRPLLLPPPLPLLPPPPLPPHRLPPQLSVRSQRKLSLRFPDRSTRGLVRRARAGHVDTWSHARCVGQQKPAELPITAGLAAASTRWRDRRLALRSTIVAPNCLKDKRSSGSIP